MVNGSRSSLVCSAQDNLSGARVRISQSYSFDLVYSFFTFVIRQGSQKGVSPSFMNIDIECAVLFLAIVTYHSRISGWILPRVMTILNTATILAFGILGFYELQE